MRDTWRSVIGYEGCYEVSPIGDVKRIKRKTQARLDTLSAGMARLSL